MSQIPTAKEYLKQLDEESGTVWTEDDDGICNAFIHFAQIHVKKALEIAANKKFKSSTGNNNVEHTTNAKKSILNAYPKENIK